MGVLILLSLELLLPFQDLSFLNDLWSLASKNWNELVQALGTVISVILTYWIIMIYRKQKDIERLHHKPSILTKRVSIADSDEKKLEVELSNVGKGAAKDIQIESEIKELGDGDYKVIPYQTRIRRYQENAEGLAIFGNHLQAQSEPVTFLVEPEFKVIDDGEKEVITGTQLVLDLVETDNEFVRFSLNLIYTDEEDEQRKEDMIDLALPVDEKVSFGDALRRAEYFPWYDEATAEMNR